MVAHPLKTAGELATSLSQSGLVTLSRSTVSRILSFDLGLPGRRPAKKPRLTPEMREKQLEYCHRYENLTEKDWIFVAFSDESTFELFRPFQKT